MPNQPLSTATLAGLCLVLPAIWIFASSVFAPAPVTSAQARETEPRTTAADPGNRPGGETAATQTEGSAGAQAQRDLPPPADQPAGAAAQSPRPEVAETGPALIARGAVFQDYNTNGTRDAGEPGLRNVRVSNGLDVVLTGEDGRYEIPVSDETIIFITKPAGYAVPTDAHMLPRFYYIHQPDGSPAGLRYQGIDPTGPLPDAIDFPLTAREESEAFSAILFADTQPQTDAELDYIRDDVIAELIGTDARFGMTLGDIMFDDLSLFPRYNAIIAQLGIPWHNVAGNHELNFAATNDRHSLETFKRFFGPPYYAFEHGKAVFFVLDNFIYKGSGNSDPGDVRRNGGYEARISDRQLQWIKNELTHIPEDRLIFFAMHAPLRTYVGEPENPQSNTQNRRELFSLVEGRKHLYAVAGHTHTSEHHYFGADDGFAGPGTFHHHVLATVSGSWWSGPLDERGIPVADQRDGTPNGYNILDVDGTNLTVSFKAAGKPADYQMRIIFDVAHHGLRAENFKNYHQGELFDGRITADEVAAAEILVNLFDGGPKSKVEFAIGNGAFQPMERVIRPDPVAHELFERHRATVKPWVKAEPSSHIFSADLPDHLAAGTYTVTVRARDEFGRTHHGHRILEISGTSAGPRAAAGAGKAPPDNPASASVP